MHPPSAASAFEASLRRPAEDESNPRADRPRSVRAPERASEAQAFARRGRAERTAASEDARDPGASAPAEGPRPDDGPEAGGDGPQAGGAPEANSAREAPGASDAPGANREVRAGGPEVEGGPSEAAPAQALELAANASAPTATPAWNPATPAIVSAPIPALAALEPAPAPVAYPEIAPAGLAPTEGALPPGTPRQGGPRLGLPGAGAAPAKPQAQGAAAAPSAAESAASAPALPDLEPEVALEGELEGELEPGRPGAELEDPKAPSARADSREAFGARAPGAALSPAPAREEAAALAKTELPRAPHDAARSASIFQQVRVQLGPELRQATLELRPESLGRIEVRVALEGGRMRAQLRVERAETLAALERYVPELKAALGAQEIETESFELSLGFGEREAEQAPRDGGEGARFRAHAGAVRAAAARAEQSLRERLGRALPEAAGVDTYV